MYSLKSLIRSCRARIQERRLRSMSVQQIFEEIYKKGMWGGDASGSFNSGSGSEKIATDPYVEVVLKYIQDNSIKSVVDLGCGDFRVGRQLSDFPDLSYIGVDVVRPLIQNLNATFGGERVRFLCMDIINEQLPQADLYLVRQVFQPLSNEQIILLLRKLNSKKVIVTEHIPVGPRIKPNKNKNAGPSIRLYRNSGVFLEAQPFSLSLETLLEISLPFNGRKAVLRTSLIDGLQNQ